jgi:hypothetical protein
LKLLFGTILQYSLPSEKNSNNTEILSMNNVATADKHDSSPSKLSKKLTKSSKRRSKTRSRTVSGNSNPEQNNVQQKSINSSPQKEVEELGDEPIEEKSKITCYIF